MRQGSNHKRLRGRGGPRRHSQPSRNQTFDSNGPGGRIRGNAYQVYEKYLALARDAYSSGDRVTAENYYQHAEHYYRIFCLANEARAVHRPPEATSAEQPGDGRERTRNGGGPDGARDGNGVNTPESAEATAEPDPSDSEQTSA